MSHCCAPYFASYTCDAIALWDHLDWIPKACRRAHVLYRLRRAKHSCRISHVQAKELHDQSPDDVCERDHRHLRKGLLSHAKTAMIGCQMMFMRGHRPNECNWIAD